VVTAAGCASEGSAAILFPLRLDCVSIVSKLRCRCRCWKVGTYAFRSTRRRSILPAMSTAMMVVQQRTMLKDSSKTMFRRR